MPGNDKRSLLEIQEEEQARQAEDDFLKWWTAEEERVKLQAQVQRLSPGTQGKGSRRGPRRKASAKNTDAVGGTGWVQSEGIPPGRSPRHPAKH